MKKEESDQDYPIHQIKYKEEEGQSDQDYPLSFQSEKEEIFENETEQDFTNLNTINTVKDMADDRPMIVI